MSNIKKWTKNDGETLRHAAPNRDDSAVIIANLAGEGTSEEHLYNLERMELGNREKTLLRSEKKSNRARRN